MNAVGVTTLDCQRDKLEREIIQIKHKLCLIKESEFPDMISINQLKDAIERNMQLITMIDRHLYSGGRQRLSRFK